MSFFKKKLILLVATVGMSYSSLAQDTLSVVEWCVMASTNFSGTTKSSEIFTAALNTQLVYNINKRFAVGVDYYRGGNVVNQFTPAIYNKGADADRDGDKTIQNVRQYGILVKATLLRKKFVNISLSYLINRMTINSRVIYVPGTLLTFPEQDYLNQQFHATTGFVNGLSFGLDLNLSKRVAAVLRITNNDLFGYFDNKKSMVSITSMEVQNNHITNITMLTMDYVPIDISLGLNFRIGKKSK